MRIHPILTALMRNKTGVVLIAIQVAVTLAIVANAATIIADKVSVLSEPPGVDEANIFHLTNVPFAAGYDQQAGVNADLAYLRSQPGVVAATLATSLPFTGPSTVTTAGTTQNANTDADGIETLFAYYVSDEHFLDTLGISVVEGRNFNAQDVKHFPADGNPLGSGVIVSQSMANKLFPDGDAVGQTIYISRALPQTIIGVVERLPAPFPLAEFGADTAIAPALMPAENLIYAIRAEPGARDTLMRDLAEGLRALDSGRIIRGVTSLTASKRSIFANERASAIMMLVVIVALAAVIFVGIVGLSSFWVTSRTKQIGTRRALGATRGQVIRHFLFENTLMIGCGVLLGVALAIAVSTWLVDDANAIPLEIWALVVSAAMLFALGQLATLGPAKRAAKISPATATRTI